MSDDLLSRAKRADPTKRTSDTPRRRRRVTEVDQLRSEMASCRSHISSLQREVDELRQQLSTMTASPARELSGVTETGKSEHFTADSVAVPAHSPRAAELRWLEEHYDELAATYRGKAIAIFADRVVAADVDLEVVVHQAREAGYVDALFTAIPESAAQHRV